MKWTLILVFAIALMIVVLIFTLNMKLIHKLTTVLLKREDTVANYKRKNDMYEQWLKLMYRGHNISNYIKNSEYASIALFGLGEAGRLLVKELDQSSIPIDYIIEPNIDSYKYKGHIIKKDFDKAVETGAIIITEFANYDYVCERLESLLECPIIALDELLFLVESY